MPHIIVKRSDAAASRRLQVLDLRPNTSLANFPYRPVQQTKYLEAAQRSTPQLATSGTSTFLVGAASGLEGWFLTNVSNGTPISATATITVGSPGAGDAITINGNALTGVAGARTSGSDDFNVTGGGATAAADIVAAINDGANSFDGDVTAANVGAVVTITAVAAGAAGNAVTLATNDAVELAISGDTLEGGSDGSALSASEAETNADDVLGLIAFDDLATAAVDVDLASVNGALTTGTITAGQLPELLDLLAGREYTVPAGVEIDDDGVFGSSPAVGAAGGPSFGPVRRIVDGMYLVLSVNEGQLSKLLDSGYLVDGVGGTQGEAVVVLNDDGTLF